MFELQLDGYPAGQGYAGSYGYTYATRVANLKSQDPVPYASEMGPGQQDVDLHPDHPGTAYLTRNPLFSLSVDVKGAPNLGLNTWMLTTDDLTRLAPNPIDFPNRT